MGRRYYSDETLPQDSDTRAVSEKARDGLLTEDNRVATGGSDIRNNVKNREEQRRGLVHADFRGNGVKDLRKEEQDPQIVPSREKRLMEKKKFVRYSEGAALYSMNRKTFARMAVEAHAVYKIDRLCLVNTEVFEEYLETYRV